MDRHIQPLQRRGTLILLTVAALWGLAVTYGSAAGVLRALPPLAVAPLIGLGVILPAAVYALSKGFRTYIETLGLRALSGFHAWRIGAGLVFFWYGAHDLLPPVFVRNAGWGDFITGVLAIVVMIAPKTATRYWALHLFGFTDLLLAVGTGLTLFLLHDPRMAGIQTLPMALIPLYGVGISGANHIMAFHLLSKGSTSVSSNRLRAA